MSKESLNLSIEKEVKDRAKRIAKQRKMSVSKLFEEVLERVEDSSDDYSPSPGSAAERIYNVIPESQKLTSRDYDELKRNAIKQKYGL